MGCECYQIGGPFIGADPNCPVHGPGGAQDQQDELDALRCEMTQMQEVIANLRDRVSRLEKQTGDPARQETRVFQRPPEQTAP